MGPPMILILVTVYHVGKGSDWTPQPINVQLHAAEAVSNARVQAVPSAPMGSGLRLMELA